MLSCGLAGLLPPGCYSSRFWPSWSRSFCCCSKWFWMWSWGTAVDIMCLLQNPKSKYGGFAVGYGTNVMATATCSITKYDDLIKLGTEKPLQMTAATCVDSGINIL